MTDQPEDVVKQYCATCGEVLPPPNTTAHQCCGYRKGFGGC